MENLTLVELQNLKKIIEEKDLEYKKLNVYINQTQDEQIKQLFKKAMQNSLNVKHKLMSFFND